MSRGVPNRTNQLLCAHSTLLFLVLVGGGFVVAGWVPPSPPDGGFEAIAARLQGTNVRVAAAMFFFGSALFVGLGCAIAAQLRRIEGERQVLATLQLLGAAVGVLGIQIPAGIWLAVTYYDGVPAALVAVLNALAWFFLLGAVGPAVLQNVAIALCVLGSDGSVYPRWLGYLNLYMAFGLCAGILIPFFPSGPFSWNGVIGFWLVAVDFFAWVTLMWVYTVKAINRDVPATDAAEAPVAA
jgi:hypothetical protein